jgi:hypothetical protein
MNARFDDNKRCAPNSTKPLEPMKIQKHLTLLALHARLLLLLGALLLALAPASRASVAAPYSVDVNTLHLWHCDETTGNQIFDAVSNNLQTVPITMTAIYGKSNAPVGLPTQFATNYQPAALPFQLPQLGSSIQTTQYSGFYGPFTIATNADGTTNISPVGVSAQAGVYVPDNVTNINNYINPTTGAFTWEMLIQPSGNLLNPNHIQELFGWEGGGAPWARALQWRIYTSLSNNVSAARLYYQEISSGNGNPSPDIGQNQTVWQAALPATGPDAVVPGQWYHVAMTFSGTAPTNGDAANVLTMYWTAVSLANTECHVLRTFTKTNNLVGMVFPNIGGYTRANMYNNVSSANGFEGNIDEVRISSVCRKANEMFFTNGAQAYRPYFPVQPPSSKLVGYGQTLTLNAVVDASPAATITWKHNGVVLTGQTNAILQIANVTFAANGNYQCFATNANCGASSTVCAVTVGAVVDELFGTGMDDNGQPRGATAPGAADLHWFLVQNPDAATPYPSALIWNASRLPNAYYADTPSACWIGPYVPPATDRVAGIYQYETHFLVDQADVNTVTITGQPFFMTGMPTGTTIQLFLNGVETDFTANGGINSPMAPFTLTKANGLVAGPNTLDLVVNCSTPGGNAEVALMLGLSGIGQALPPGLPAISNQPPSQAVAYGTNVSMAVVAVGRPPLSYQWLSNGVPVPGANQRSLSFVATNFGPAQVVGNTYTAHYQAVISNDSGSVTSAVATLTVTIPPLTVASAGIPIWNPTDNRTNIVVLFSAAVDPVTAVFAGNYSLDNGASVLSAVMGDAPNKVILTTSALNPAVVYNLTIQNVKDWYNIPMPSSSSVLVGSYPAAVALWLRADTGVSTNSDGTVAQWNDLSGNGNHLLAGAVAPVLASDPVNGQPVVRFDGTSGTYLYAGSTPSLALTGDMTILAVVNFAPASGNTNGMIVSKVNGNNQPAPYDYYRVSDGVNFLRGNGAGNAGVRATKAPSTGVPHLVEVTMKGTAVTHRLDGLANGSGTLVTTMVDTGHPLSLGVREDGINRLTGDLAELVVIGSALSAYDVASLENYLSKAHGLQFVNTSPTNIVLSVGAGNQITLSWPLDHVSWQLQSNSVGLTATGAWFTVAGSTATNQVILTPDATRTNVFYRMVYP